MNINKNSFLFNEISSLKGVGLKTKKYLERKRIEKIKDLLWDLPYSIIDRSKSPVAEDEPLIPQILQKPFHLQQIRYYQNHHYKHQRQLMHQFLVIYWQ